jgi:hypothetical protein
VGGADLGVAQLRRTRSRTAHHHARALTVLHQAYVERIADDAQVFQRALDAFSESRRAEHQVFEYFAAERRQVRAQVQADIRIAADDLDHFPEHGLHLVRRACLTRRLLRVVAEPHVDGIDVEAGFHHALVDHLQQLTGIAHVGRARFTAGGAWCIVCRNDNGPARTSHWPA